MKRKAKQPVALVSGKTIEQRIFVIRNARVMFDTDLAVLYGVTTKAFNQAVKRNLNRFPADFMFQLGLDEVRDLRSQFVTSSWGGRRYRPYVFTEHGVAMLSAVLKSDRAAEMNILIIRAFIRLREVLASHKELAKRIADLEAEQQLQGSRIAAIYDLVQQLLEEPEPVKRRIGFRGGE